MTDEISTQKTKPDLWTRVANFVSNMFSMWLDKRERKDNRTKYVSFLITYTLGLAFGVPKLFEHLIDPYLEGLPPAYKLIAILFVSGIILSPILASAIKISRSN